MKYNYHAITLEKFNIGEGDRLYTFYTLEKGLLRIPARSVAKNKSKLASQVEDFVLTHITVAKNYGQGVLAGAVAEDYFVELHENYHALRCVDDVRTLVLFIVEENYKDKRIFELFVEYLSKMNEIARKNNSLEMQFEWITHSFLIKLFFLLGYEFHLKRCCVCKGEINEIRNGFSPGKGGLLCQRCYCSDYFCKISPDTLKAIRIINNNKLKMLCKLNVNNNVNKELTNVIDNINRWIRR